MTDSAEYSEPRTTIGILAGMGPRSTAPFVDLVIDECQLQYGARYDDDYPAMMVYSLPTPFRLDQPLDHSAMRRAVRSGLVRLARTGVDFVAMPCNTTHIYYDELAASISVPLLDMIELAIAAIPPSARRIAPLATAATMDAGLYQSRLVERGISVVEDPEIRRAVDRILEAVKDSPDPETARALWVDLLSDLPGREVDAALLACTDLSPARSRSEPALPVVDATRELAAATVRHWRRLA